MYNKLLGRLLAPYHVGRHLYGIMLVMDRQIDRQTDSQTGRQNTGLKPETWIILLPKLYFR